MDQWQNASGNSDARIADENVHAATFRHRSSSFNLHFRNAVKVDGNALAHAGPVIPLYGKWATRATYTADVTLTTSFPRVCFAGSLKSTKACAASAKAYVWPIST